MTLRKRVDELTDSVERINAINQQLGGRLKLYQRLLDRAMQGLEYYLPVDGYENEAQQTLADIRKALDGAALKTTTGHDNNTEKRGKR